jgi:hypothetical protein
MSAATVGFKHCGCFWVTAIIDGKCWENVMPSFWLMQKWMKSQKQRPHASF